MNTLVAQLLAFNLLQACNRTRAIDYFSMAISKVKLDKVLVDVLIPDVMVY